AAREVAVVAHAEGRIALRREREGTLRIPAGNGSGEEACRQVLRSTLGRAQGQVRLIGTSIGVGTQPTVEIWLAERLHPGEPEDGDPLEWLSLDEFLPLVGTPVVRERRTLAALSAVVRVGL